MSKFIESFIETMPESQKKQILELLEQRKKDGLIRSDGEFKLELERLMSEIKEGSPTFKAIKQKGKIDSSIHNENMEKIAFDLNAIFNSSNTIDRLLTSHHQLSKASLIELKRKIQDMRSAVEYFQLLLNDDTGSYISGVTEQFYAPKLTEVNEDILTIMRKDRFGESRSRHFNAEVVGDSLQLASIESEDQIKTNYGRQIASIRVRNRIGLMAEDQKYPIENAIDGSPDTFWAESVLVDDVIVQDIDDLWSHDYHDYPKTGALCEIEILLNGLSTVSEISFDPFTSYPLEIVSIHGYENENRTGEMYDLISPNHPNPYQRSQKSVNRMVFQFPSVEISMIRMLIRQENYTKENFLINEEQLQESKLWDELTNDKYLIRDYKEPGETIAEFDRKNEIAGWNVYLKKLQEWATIFKQAGLVEAAKAALEVVKIGDYKNPLLLSLFAIDKNQNKSKVYDKRSPMLAANWKPINKLSYLYGAYDISIYGRKYQRSSIYITENLPLSSNTEQIGLVTEEKHHYISVGPDEVDPTTNKPVLNSYKITDIEYYVTNKSNPSSYDWIPILPENHKYVEGELLFGDDDLEPCPELQTGETINFALRFKFISKDTVVVRRNGIPMNPDMYILCTSGKKIGIKKEYYSPTSIYTIDYKPVPEAYVVNIKDQLNVTPTQYINEKGEVGEYFETVDQDNSIELSNLPYLHRDFLYEYRDSSYVDKKEILTPDQFTYPLIVRVNGVEFKNITDYTNNHYNPERLKENSGRTFAHIRNKIIFGNPNNMELKNIIVDYYYLTSSLRLKAILRRNHAGYESITPALVKYHIKAKTFDQSM